MLEGLFLLLLLCKTLKGRADSVNVNLQLCTEGQCVLDA